MTAGLKSELFPSKADIKQICVKWMKKGKEPKLPNKGHFNHYFIALFTGKGLIDWVALTPNFVDFLMSGENCTNACLLLRVVKFLLSVAVRKEAISPLCSRVVRNFKEICMHCQATPLWITVRVCYNRARLSLTWVSRLELRVDYNHTRITNFWERNFVY